MEISEIQKSRQIHKVQNKQNVNAVSQIEDRIHISVEAEKRVKWVEMLKKMPDVRSEKIEDKLAASYKQEVHAAVAQKLMNQVI